jgi:hypothetical protein
LSHSPYEKHVMPELMISSEKVGFLIEKARQCGGPFFASSG